MTNNESEHKNTNQQAQVQSPNQPPQAQQSSPIVEIKQETVEEVLETNLHMIMAVGSLLLIIIFIAAAKWWIPNNQLGNVGSYISAITATVAWIWLILGYALQYKELKLQRKEIAESVKAQQGSEKALAEQVEFMRSQVTLFERQLTLQEKQINEQIQDKENNKPKFVLVSNFRFGIPQSDIFSTKFTIKDIKQSAEITYVEFKYYNRKPVGSLKSRFDIFAKPNDSETGYQIEMRTNLPVNPEAVLIERQNILPNGDINTDIMMTDEQLAIQKVNEEYLLDIVFTIHYNSQRIGYGADDYSFVRNDNKLIMVRNMTQYVHIS